MSYHTGMAALETPARPLGWDDEDEDSDLLDDDTNLDDDDDDLDDFDDDDDDDEDPEDGEGKETDPVPSSSPSLPGR